MAVLIDTGPLVALLNQRDPYHRWARRAFDTVAPPIYSCEAVITEAYHLLRGVSRGHTKLRALIQAEHIRIAFRYDEHIPSVHALLTKYADLPMDFADACLVRMAELDETSRVFTIDSDFHVYRAHGDRVIDVIMPD